MLAATQDLQRLAETDAQDLGFLLHLLENSERQSLAQVGTAPHGGPSPAPLQHLGWETPRPGAPGMLTPRAPGLTWTGGGMEVQAGGTQIWPAQALTPPETSGLLYMRRTSHS